MDVSAPCETTLHGADRSELGDLSGEELVSGRTMGTIRCIVVIE